MNKFRNTNLKFLIIPMIIVTICTSIVLSIVTVKQYKKVINIVNIKMANILGEVKDNYPDVDAKEIIKILNSDIDNSKFNNGKQELLSYGIDVEEINAILSIQNQMEINLKVNILIIIVFNIIWIIAILIYLNKRNKKLKEIKKYIEEISNRNYQLDIEENSEDELSNLKNELYKITVMLKEESENSKKDKENLKISVQDISHQLKTPLTSISIMLDNIKENPEMDEKIKQKFIFEISRQIEWINWLVISMLKLSKLDVDAVEFYSEKINVSKFINKIIKNLEIPIEIKNQNIIIEGKESCYFEGDYKWQQEAVTNIVKNCIEHNKNDGNIFIKYEENNLYTKISIKDEGEGIAKEDLRHIFERFYKGKNSSENSIGIGLALSKSIIEKNSGIITCNSELGKGTEFIIKYMKKVVKGDALF